MPIKTPRLHRDRKSGGYFFRYKLPAILAERLGKVSVYQSLKTKDFALAKARALYLNLHLEMSRHKLNPNNIKLDDLRELLKIDVKNGIFEADTAEEAAQGLKVLEAMKGAYGRSVTIDEIEVVSPEMLRITYALAPERTYALKATSTRTMAARTMTFLALPHHISRHSSAIMLNRNCYSTQRSVQPSIMVAMHPADVMRFDRKRIHQSTAQSTREHWQGA